MWASDEELNAAALAIAKVFPNVRNKSARSKLAAKKAIEAITRLQAEKARQRSLNELVRDHQQ